VARARSEVERSLIQWICVRPEHRKKRPVDPSSPFNVHEEGGWSYCPAGETEGHRWYRTGGVTREALARFEWPDEPEDGD
jgi:hypothetical protein